jgi:molybdopterin-guanine dinucleotide biosynthesis protein MobB
MATSLKSPPPRPTIVSVLGLKNTGKTTAAVAVISGLSARGLRVAAVKSSHLAQLDLDPRGRDSRQLYDAGALCVVAQGREESLIVRRHDTPAPLSELLELMPPGLHFVVLEGGGALQADAVLLCLRDLSQLEETLKVRHVPVHRVRAVTGVLANCPAGRRESGLSGGDTTDPDSPSASQHHHPETVAIPGASPVPLLDATDSQGREELIALVLRAAGGSGTP